MQVAPSTPVQPRAPVCVVARTLVAWTANPLQVVYARESSRCRPATLEGAAKGGRGWGAGKIGLHASDVHAFASKRHAASILPAAVLRPATAGHAGAPQTSQRKAKVTRFQYAHGCLHGHLLAGEEAFAVEWDHSDGSVW